MYQIQFDGYCLQVDLSQLKTAYDNRNSKADLFSRLDSLT